MIAFVIKMGNPGYPESSKPMCDWATEYWWQLWEDFQFQFNLTRSRKCPNGYEPLNLSPGKWHDLKPHMYATPQKFLD